MNVCLWWGRSAGTAVLDRVLVDNKLQGVCIAFSVVLVYCVVQLLQKIWLIRGVLGTYCTPQLTRNYFLYASDHSGR